VYRLTLTLFCLAAVLLATGCGGGGSSSGDRLSEAEFQSRANQICTKVRDQEKPSTTKEGTDRNLGLVESALSDLQDLKPPKEHEAQYQDLLTNFQRALAFVKANESRLLSLGARFRANPSDPRVAAAYRRLVQPYVKEAQRAAADATALGLTACASGLAGGGGSSG
jgi:hypothetical protein